VHDGWSAVSPSRATQSSTCSSVSTAGRRGAGAVSVLVTGVGAPQGLAFLPDDGLLVVDESSGTIAIAQSCA
jgi:hypothetical protein